MSTTPELMYIQQEVADNPTESHKAIAERVGISVNVVKMVCNEMTHGRCKHGTAKPAKPVKKAKKIPGTQRKTALTDEEIEKLVKLRYELGVGRGYVREEFGIGEHAAQLAVSRADGILFERYRRRSRPTREQIIEAIEVAISEHAWVHGTGEISGSGIDKAADAVMELINDEDGQSK